MSLFVTENDAGGVHCIELAFIVTINSTLALIYDYATDPDYVYTYVCINAATPNRWHRKRILFG